MSEEWGPWIEHDGSGCPCVGVYVRFEIGQFLDVNGDVYMPEDSQWSVPGGVNDREWEGVVHDGSGWDWGDSDYFPVIRYRIRKPKGLTILESVLRKVEREDA